VARPGGVTLNSTYNQMNWLTAETGSGGATSTTLVRTLGYDLSGEVTSFATPSGSQSVGYNDRGNVISSSGPEGSASYTYNADDQLTQRTDGSGTANFAWTPTGHAATASDPLTGTTRTYTYDGAGEKTQISYGTGKAVETFGYDSAGRQSSDVLATSGGTTLYSLAYTYDPNSNIASTTVGPTGVAGYGAAANTYAYDWANELTSWTNTSGALTSYTYDQAGNRTAAGSTTFAYDQRNRLTSSVAGTTTTSYAYTARGTLLSTVAGSTTTNYAADAFDRVTTAGTSTYSYDSLDRIAAANGSTFSYAGIESGVVGDGSKLYARGPAGELLAEGTNTSNDAVVSDIHGDIVATLTPSATSLFSSTNFDPFGNVTATTGVAPGFIGFQGEWRDKTAGTGGLVSMGSRFYSPSIGQFISQDTAPPAVTTGIGMNGYAYVGNDPLNGVDPTGHDAIGIPLGGTGAATACGAAPEACVAVGIIGLLGFLAYKTYQHYQGGTAAGSPGSPRPTSWGGGVGPLTSGEWAYAFSHLHWPSHPYPYVGSYSPSSGAASRGYERVSIEPTRTPPPPVWSFDPSTGWTLSGAADTGYGQAYGGAYGPGGGLLPDQNWGQNAGPAPGSATAGLQKAIHATPTQFTPVDAANPATQPFGEQGAECANSGGAQSLPCPGPPNPAREVANPASTAETPPSAEVSDPSADPPHIGNSTPEGTPGNNAGTETTQTQGEKPLTEGNVFRGGSSTSNNLTPRVPQDTTGLSTFDTLEGATEPGGKAQCFDVSCLEQGGLGAFEDPEPPGHVSIRPLEPGGLEDWLSSRANGTEATSPFTQFLQDVAQEVRLPK
jgi:RHS repeat-associated protein